MPGSFSNFCACFWRRNYDCCICPCPDSYDNLDIVLPGTTSPLTDFWVVVTGTQQLSARATFSDCNGTRYYTLPTDSSGWSSADATVASVTNTSSSHGLATGVKGGTAAIGATYQHQSCSSSLPCDCQTFSLDASSTAHVQVPSYFTPTGFSAPIISGCPSGNDGYFAEVYYQVTDQNKDAIHLAGMTPQEHFTVSGHPAFFGFKPFATPRSTPGSGAFADTPIGSCIAPPSPPNHCVDVVQTFDLVIGTQTFTINTTTTRRDCQDGIRVQIVPGTTYTQGTVN